MKEQNKGQVLLSKLIFTHNWEDPLVDEKGLKIKPGDSVFTITSGGCNTIGFLKHDPGEICCVDINEAQTFLMELKQASFRNLSYEEMIAFIGLTSHANREKTFLSLSKDLSAEARQFWNQNLRIIRQGILMNGRYEKFVKIAGWLLRTLQGSRKTRKLFSLTSLEEQRSFYETEWNNRRWKWIFETMFNKKRLASKGLNADYFHFDDGSTSFSESFQRRAAHAICDIPVQQNYFLALYLLGHYYQSSYPDYLKAENFQIIRERIDRIKPVTLDSKYWLEKQNGNRFQAMALSNICELMDEADTLKLFQEVLRTCSPGARIMFRNLMVPREVPESLRSSIVKDESLSKTLQAEDRSFVYGKVAAYVVHK